MCCGMSSYSSPAPTKQRVSPAPVASMNEVAPQVLASEDKTKKVKLRYYGGELSLKAKPACPTCGGGGQYAMTTGETIMFRSEDAPDGVFKLFVQAGREYYVTEKQAEYMLTLTFRNRAGQIINKFKRIES